MSFGQKILLYFKLWFLQLRKHGTFIAVSSVGILFGISFYIGFGAVTTSIGDIITGRLIGDLPINTIRVTHTVKTQGLGALLGAKNFHGISDKQYNTIKEMPGVKRVDRVQILQRKLAMGYPMPKLKLPGSDILNSLSKSIFGNTEEKEEPEEPKTNYLMFDAVIVGVSDALVKGDLRILKNFRQYKDVVPVLVPKAYVDLMRSYLAINGLPNNMLPKTTGKWPVIDLKLRMGYTVGLKSLNPGAQVTNYQARVAGMMTNNSVMAFAAPLGWVQKLNKEKYPKAAKLYRELFVEIENSKDLEATTKAIKDMGLIVSSSTPIARKARETIDLVQTFFDALSFVILFLAALAIANAFFLIVIRRQKDLALLRFLGAPGWYVGSLLVLEAAVVGVLYGLLAYALTAWGLDFLSGNLGEWIPFLPISDIAFTMPPGTFARTLLYSVLCSILACLFPLVLVFRSQILQTLRR